MKKLFALGATFAALSGGTAFAADIPPAPPRPTPVPAYRAPAAVPMGYDWTGFYIGGNVGYSWGKDNLNLSTVSGDGGVFDVSGSTSLKPAGIIGGGQIGFNYQTSWNLVWGVEADIQASAQKANKTETASLDGLVITTDNTLFCVDPNCTITDGTSTGKLESKLTWFGTVRGRLGFAWDRVLFYGTGGLAYGEVKQTLTGAASGTFTDTNACVAPCAFTASASASGSKTKVGWVAGVGIEGAFFNNWIWRVEYLYLDLGSDKITAPVALAWTPNPGTATGSISYTSSVTDHIVRFGLSYKFGGGPVMARY